MAPRDDRGRDRGGDRDRAEGSRDVQRQLDDLSRQVTTNRTLLESTSRLALQTAHRVQSANTQRSIISFWKGAAKQGLLDKWKTWQRNSRLPVSERPVERPPPFREQFAGELLQFITHGAQMQEDITPDDVRTMQALPRCVESVQVFDQRSESDEALPVLVLFRNSESACFLRSELLAEKYKCIFGKTHEVGIRPARPDTPGPVRGVLQGLGLPIPEKGVGKGRRSPKREVEGADAEASRSRQRTTT